MTCEKAEGGGGIPSLQADVKSDNHDDRENYPITDAQDLKGLTLQLAAWCLINGNSCVLRAARDRRITQQVEAGADFFVPNLFDRHRYDGKHR